ncbi:MAG: L-threonylcarbamoyladenylate synthase [Thermoplasmatota archaeon]
MTARILRRDARSRAEVLRLLDRGEVVAIPTDLTYGLAAKATRPDALARIRALKSKHIDTPLPVLASAESAGRFARLDADALRAVALGWPGAFSILAPRLDTIPDAVTANLANVVLLSPDAWVAELADAAPFPIAATSANATGEPPCVTADECFKRFGREVNLVLDGGPSRLGRHSTIVDVTSRPPRILRDGAASASEVRKFLPMLA